MLDTQYTINISNKGSRWTMQAQQLDGRIGNSFTIKPDQFQAINPIIIVFLVPLFDFVIYPLFAKINLLKRQLQRMCIGLLFGIAAFIIAAILESRMQAAVIAANPSDQIRIINLSPCQIQLDLNTSLVNIGFSNQTSIKIDQFFFPADQNLTQVQINALCSNNSTIKNFITVSKSNLPKNLLIYLDKEVIKLVEYRYNNKNSLIGYSLLKYDAFQVKSFEILSIVVGNNIVKYTDTLNVGNLLQNSNLFVNNTYRQLDYAVYDLT